MRVSGGLYARVVDDGHKIHKHNCGKKPRLIKTRMKKLIYHDTSKNADPKYRRDKPKDGQ